MLLQAVTQQVTTAPPTLSLGEWLGAIVAALTILGVVYRIGGLATEMRSIKTLVEKTIADLSAKIDDFITSSNSRIPEWTGWRKETDGRLSRVEADQAADKEARHEMRNDLGGRITDHETRLSLLEQGERRTGPSDRRE